MKASAQPDLFIAVADVPFRDQLDLMAVPIVSLAKSRRVEPIRFKRGDNEVEVSAPAHLGLATIYDFDLVLWAVSQLNERIERGGKPSPTVVAPAYDVLKAIGRGTSGADYQRLRAAADRLTGTLIRTNIRARKGRRLESFHLVEAVTWQEDETGRPRGLAVTLPSWLFKAVVERRVLALDPRYFGLTSGLARWLYRLSRKAAGANSAGWAWPLPELHARSGVSSPLKAFTQDLRQLVATNALPEFWLSLYRDADDLEHVHAVRRSHLALNHPGREFAVSRRRRLAELA